jgi:hypothetical protein
MASGESGLPWAVITTNPKRTGASREEGRRAATRHNIPRRMLENPGRTPRRPPHRSQAYIEGMVIPQVTRVVRRSRSGPAPRERACAHRTGTWPGRDPVAVVPTAANAPAVSQRYPLVAGAHSARAFVGEHSSRLRECFAIFSTRSCSMSHIAHLRSEADFFPTQVAVWQLFPAHLLRSPPLHSIASLSVYPLG